MGSITSSVRCLTLAMAGAAALALASTGGSYAETAVRTVKIATSAESKPLAWGAIGVEPQGYEPDLLRAINAKLPQYKFEMEGLGDIAQETGLSTGKYDMACEGYIKTPQRSKQFLIPDNPEGASLMKIYSRKGSNLNKLEDLVGKRIVPITPGGGVYRFVTQWKKDHPDANLEFATSSAGIPYPNRLNEIQDGKYDAMILPSNVGEQDVIQNPKLDIQASEPIEINNIYLLIHRSKENEVLADDVSRILKELKDDGTMAKLSQKWFGEDIVKYMK